MTCLICKQSKFESANVTVTLERGAVALVFKDVPAKVCENCGEQYVDERTSAKLLSEAENAAPPGMQVEFRSFAAL